MRTSEIFKNKKLVMSAEVFPPKKSGSIEGVVRALRDIEKVAPDYVSITYGAGGEGAQTTADVASIAIDAFGLNAVAHMTAINMTRAKLSDQLDTLRRKGIDNILVLRGDTAQNSRFLDFHHANELAAFIRSVDPSFNLIGACYPEKHPEARTLAADVDNLEQKIDSGVSHLITQLFFDNSKFYRFMDLLLARGISVPVCAGIMPILKASQLSRTTQLSNAAIPERLQSFVDASPLDCYARGMDFAAEQIDDLIKNGVRGIHLYTMNNGGVALDMFKRFKDARI